MKKKKLIILGTIIVIIAVVVTAIIQVPKWSQKSFEAIVQKTITQSNGEVRLIVKRTTDIYSNSQNSLHISKDTELVGANGKPISIDDLGAGNTIRVNLKDAFIEETPFYYPIVYEIKVISTNE